MIARVSTTKTTAVARAARGDARRTSGVARASSKEQACATVLALTIAATPMANAAVEVTQVAAASDVAAELFAAQQAKANSKPAKPAKSFAAPSAPSAPSMPSFSAPSLPSFSAPSLPSFGSKKADAPKAEAPKAEKKAESSGSSEGLSLGVVMAVLFSPLLVVQAVTFQTFARLAGQAGGKK